MGWGLGKEMSTILIFSRRSSGWDLETALARAFVLRFFLILFSNEAHGSLHCHSDPVSDPWRVPGFWDYKEAVVRTVVRKGRCFLLLKVLKKYKHSRPSLLKSSFLIFLAQSPWYKATFSVQSEHFLGTKWPQRSNAELWNWLTISLFCK